MPIYNYKCEECENQQEELHLMKGPDYTIKCNKCESKK